MGSTDELDDLRNGFAIWRLGSTNELNDLRNGFAIWRLGHYLTNELGLRFSGFVGALGSISPSPVLGAGAISLPCCLSLSLSLALSLFYAWPGNGLKVKWFCKMISGQMRQILVKLKCFSVNSIFHSCQTRGFYGKWFPKTVFSQFKCSLNEKK